MFNLQIRIVTAITFVCSATLIVVAVYVGRATILVHIGPPPATALAAARDALSGTVRRTHSLAAVQLEVARLGAKYRASMFLVDPNTGLIATSLEPNGVGRVTIRPDGTFELTLDAPGSPRHIDLVLRGGTPIADDRGGERWRLFMFATDPSVDELAPVRGLILRAIWESAAVGFAAALLVAILLGSYIGRPLRELTAAANSMSQGETSRRVKVRATDEIGRLASAFNQMADSIENIERLRRQMITDVAHELRSPLTRMVLQIEAAADGHVSQTEALDDAREQTSRLVHIVNDLRDLSLADAHQLAIAQETVFLGKCIDEAIQRTSNGAAHGQIAFHRDVDPNLPSAVGDESRVAQILDNLISNAIQHTPAGGNIFIGASAGPEFLECFVQDDGAGIAPQEHALVFERFYRADQSRSRGTGGTGLGLAIVKSLVAEQGGAVEVESALGAGSRFTFTLPRSRPPSS